MRTEVHTTPTEYGVFFIPADTDLPMEYKIINADYRDMQKLIGGHLEVIHSEFLPDLRCGCQMVMVVDEDGKRKNLPQNLRASIFYPFGLIVGDIFLIGEGPVRDEEDYIEPDYFGLPPEFRDWEPGQPVPFPEVPWE